MPTFTRKPFTTKSRDLDWAEMRRQDEAYCKQRAARRQLNTYRAMVETPTMWQRFKQWLNSDVRSPL